MVLTTPRACMTCHVAYKAQVWSIWHMWCENVYVALVAQLLIYVVNGAQVCPCGALCVLAPL